jgi:DNA-binding beta-propeller fold protein YncE
VGLHLTRRGDLLIADLYNHRVLVYRVAEERVELLAGCGRAAFSGDGGPASEACLNNPYSATEDPATGNIHIADAGNGRVRVVDAHDGTIMTTLGGWTGACSIHPHMRPLQLCLQFVTKVTWDHGGNLLLTDYAAGVVYQQDAVTKLVSPIAGHNLTECDLINFPGDGGLATAACMQPAWVTVHGNDTFVADLRNIAIRRISGDGIIHSISPRLSMGWFCGDGVFATKSCLAHPQHVATDGVGNLYIADTYNARVRFVNRATNVISTFAGTTPGMCDDENRPAVEGCLNMPQAVAVDSYTGDVYIADWHGNRVAVVYASNGTMATYAGRKQVQSDGDGLPANQAGIANPYSLAFDPFGDLLIAEYARIRLVDRQTGLIYTLAGTGTCGNAGDGGSSFYATIGCQVSMAMDMVNFRLLIADQADCVIRAIDFTTGDLTITTIAGIAGYCYQWYDGFDALDTYFYAPTSVAVDASGNVLIADGTRIRLIDSNNKVSTVVGGYLAGYGGDGSLATEALINFPGGITYDAVNKLILLADTYNNVIRTVTLAAPVYNITCPPGYVCSCGAPVPCNSPDEICLPNAVTITPPSDGYFSIPEVDGAVRIAQQICPIGSYCQQGRRHPCPRGTTGRYEMQVDVSSCEPCRAGTYLALAAGQRASAAGTSACLPCPRGSYAAFTGMSFCRWCPANTHMRTPGGACEPCDANYYSLGGPTLCVPIQAGMNVLTWLSFAHYTVATAKSNAGVGSSASTTDSTGAVTIAVPLVIAGISVLLLLVVVLLRYTIRKSKAYALAKRMLRTVDMFGLQHTVPELASPVHRNTARGGAVSVLAFGTVLALASALTTQYVLNNAQAQQPLIAPVTDSYSLLQPRSVAIADDTVSGLPGGAFSGVRVAVASMGPNCGVVAFNRTDNGSQLLHGSFFYNSTYDPVTGLAQHVFACESCAFRTISTLDLVFDSSCQTFLMTAHAAGADGAVTSASYKAEADCVGGFKTPCAIQNAAAVSFVPTLQVLADATNDVSLRGFDISPASLLLSDRQLDNTAVSVRVSLGLAPTYVNQQVSSLLDCLLMKQTYRVPIPLATGDGQNDSGTARLLNYWLVWLAGCFWLCVSTIGNVLWWQQSALQQASSNLVDSIADVTCYCIRRWRNHITTTAIIRACNTRQLHPWPPEPHRCHQ